MRRVEDGDGEDPAEVEAALLEFLEAAAHGGSPDADAFAAARPRLEPLLRERLCDLAALRHLGAAAVPAAASAAELVGRSFGRYRVLRLVGQGGMGVVFEAEQDQPRRRVALKVVRPDAANERALRRFELEAQALARLNHPGIAQVFEAGSADAGHGPQPYFAMEFVEGRSLTCFAEEQRLGLAERVELLAAIADAVHHAHMKGVIHRDLKPGNVLIDAGGRPRVLDFGVARLAAAGAADPATLATATGELVGTLQYMSPEQVSGHPDAIDTRSDIYSLAVLGYELLAGRLPYDCGAGTLAEVVAAIDSARPAPLSAAAPEARGDLETILAKALEKEPARRYASASDFADDLRRFLGSEPILARPASTWYQVRQFARRNPALAIAVGGLFAVLAGALVVSSALLRQAKQAQARAEEGRIAALVARKDLALQRGDWAGALATSRELRTSVPGAAVGLGIDEAEALLALAEHDQAERLLEAIDDADATAGERARLGVLRADMALDRWQDAAEELNSALARPLDESTRAYAKALLATDVPAAIATLQEALRLRPLHYRARQRLLALLMVSGRFPEAQEELAFVEALFPSDASVVVYASALRAFESGRPASEPEIARVREQFGDDPANLARGLSELMCVSENQAGDLGGGGGQVAVMAKLLEFIGIVQGSRRDGFILRLLPGIPAVRKLMPEIPAIIRCLVRSEGVEAAERLAVAVEILPEASLLYLRGCAETLITSQDPAERNRELARAEHYFDLAVRAPGMIAMLRELADYMALLIDVQLWSPERPEERADARARALERFPRLLGRDLRDAAAYRGILRAAAHFGETEYAWRAWCSLAAVAEDQSVEQVLDQSKPFGGAALRAELARRAAATPAK